MKHYRVRYIILGTVIALVLLTTLLPRLVKAKTSHDIRNIMIASLDLVQPGLIFNYKEDQVFVDCQDVMYFTTVCKGGVFLSTKRGENNLRPGVTPKDIENYIIRTSATLKSQGWSEYEYKTDSRPDGVTYLYFIHSKNFGSISCEVLFNYSSVDVITGKSPSFAQQIRCSRELPFIF